MKAIHVYLNFDGNCRKAMTFYAKCLDADLTIFPFSEIPENVPVPPGSGDRVMHAKLSKGSAILMASDTMPGMPYNQGNNFSVSLDCESVAEVDGLFEKLSENGETTMAPCDAFWGSRFAMLKDQFGVHWMLNHELPKEQ